MPGGRKGVRRRKQGSSASRAPGETESQREDSRAATSRRGTDGGPGGSGSLAEGGVRDSTPEGHIQNLAHSSPWAEAVM